MSKIILFVVLCCLSFLKIECLYSYDSCTINHSEEGICKPLSACHHLMEELRRAGNPMPVYMRKKLQGLGCGFDNYEPMVCCTSPDKNGEDNHSEYGNGYGIGSPDERRPTFTNAGSWPNTEEPYYHDTTPQYNRPGYQNNEVNRIGGLPDISRHPNLRLLPTNCGEIEEDRIWGGDRTQLYEMPWMVLLSYNDESRGPRLSCGGTLINQWYVLTAAHCVEFLSATMSLDGAILGEYDIRTDPDCDESGQCAPPIRNVTIECTIAHPGYTPQTRLDDIALIRLSEPADFELSSMKPICLPLTRDLQREDLDGKKVMVAGWGVTEEGMQSPVLMSISLPVVTNKECQDDYNGLVSITDGQLCAGGEENKDSCSGDSGGPLMYPGRVGSKFQYVQRGIVSYGSKRCALGGYPAIYTRVAYYMDWILDNIHS